MNKKLIKELEACGFVIGSLDILSKKLDNKYLCEYRVPTEELWISQDRSVLFTKMHQTFAQIAEKVLELTGVTLTPKQTKRQEIDTLREELETVKSRLNNLSSWAMSENKRRDVDLRALKYNLKKNGILVDPLTEPKSEPEKTEGVFKVGDPVVLNPTIDFPINSIKLEAAAQTVFTVSGTNTNCFYLSKNGKPFFKDILFYQCELLNAPIKRIFETGNRVVVKPRNTYAFGCSDSKRNKAKCSTILIIQDICGNNSVAGGLEIETNDGRYTVGELQHAPKEAEKANSVSLEDYQNAYRCACDLLTLLDEKYYEGGVIPLESVEGVISQIDNVVAGLEKRKEAAGVLKLGGWAETLTDGIYIKKGAKVLLCNVRVDDSYCYDEKGNNNWVENDNLKAL
jgi:hypothetical protein